MKDTIVHWVSLILKVLSFVTGLSVYAADLPPKWGVIAALVFGAASILKDTLNRLMNLFNPPPPTT